MIADSEYTQVVGRLGHSTFLVVRTTGLSEFSIIFECLNIDNNPANFSNQKYTIQVSNDAYDNPDPDPTSYYNVMLAPLDERWINIREVLLGLQPSCTNSFTTRNTGAAGCVLHFKYVRFTVPEIENSKIRITAAAR